MSDLNVIKKIEKLIGEPLTPCPADSDIMDWDQHNGSSRFRGVSSMCSFRVVHLWQDRSLQHIDFNEMQVSLAFLLGGTKNHI